MLRLVPRTEASDREPRHADELAQVAAAAVSGDRRAVQALLVALAPHLLRTVRSEPLATGTPGLADRLWNEHRG